MKTKLTFTRWRKIDQGRKAKTSKDKEKRYQIIYRTHCQGVALTPCYFALQLNSKGFYEIISRHRKLGPAEWACRRDANNRPQKLEVAP